jgi:hypothetical protein
MSKKYAPFIQSWIIIKSVLYVYLQLLFFVITSVGVFSLFILFTEKRVGKLELDLYDCEIPKKLSLLEKLKYPFMWYELYVNVKISKDGYYLLTKKAIDDLSKFEIKES